jgi:hypothetical protein
MSHIDKLRARNKAVRNGSLPYEDREWLRVRYEDQGKSIRQIAVEAECGSRTIARWLRTHRIETRKGTDALKARGYQGQNNPNWRGATLCRCGHKKSAEATVCQDCRSKAKVGEGNPNYKGIAKVTSIIRGWSKRHWKPLVLAQSRYSCPCGIKYGLDAHHIYPLAKIIAEHAATTTLDLQAAEGRRLFCDFLTTQTIVADSANGVALCKSCHKEHHRND